MKVTAPFAGVLLLLIASGPGVGALVGTESSPEVRDDEGNVEYHALYTGPRDRDHLDVLAAWFEFDASSNELNATLKVSSLERANESTNSGRWNVLLTFRGNVSTGSEDVGMLLYTYEFDVQGDEWKPRVSLQTTSGGVDVPFAFEWTDSSPGHVRWKVPMDYLQNWGVQIGSLRASGWEEEFADDSGFVATGAFNRNIAESSAVFHWGALAPSATTGEEEEPPEAPEGSSTPSPPRETAGATMIMVLGAGFIAAIVRRWTT